MKKIGLRTNQRIRFEAGLHGIDIGAAANTRIEPTSLTDSQKSDMEKALESAIARKMNEGRNG